MKFKDGKTFSAYVRSKLHTGYITLLYKVNNFTSVKFNVKVIANRTIENIHDK